MTSSIVLKNTASVRAKLKPTHAENSAGRALCDRPRVRKLSRLRSRVTCGHCLRALGLLVALALGACDDTPTNAPTATALPSCIAAGCEPTHTVCVRAGRGSSVVIVPPELAGSSERCYCNNQRCEVRP